MRLRAVLVVPLLIAAALAGCAADDAGPAGSPSVGAPAGTTPTGATPQPPTPATRQPGQYEAMGFDGETWPRLDGVTLTILDHGAFGAFEDAKTLFENLTGATVVHVEADDSGSALNLAAQQKGNPTFDVIYGIDNVLYARALELDVFEPYEPLLADRIDPEYVFFRPQEGDAGSGSAGSDANGAWHATPVDHGYVAVNYDPRAVQVDGLMDLVEHADRFVTPDPRTSTPGLGFLLATIAAFPEDAGTDPLAGRRYTWTDYWTGLFEGGVLVTSGWTEAYEQHFTAGYGADYGGAADKPIVTSYTTSPAYEHFFGRPDDQLARVLTVPNATFHQIETMGIAKGAKNRAAAEAWIEFALTPEFQALMAPGNAVYPVVAGVPVDGTYGGVDPAPGTFEPAAYDYRTLGANLEGWIRAWTDLCEAHDCA